MCRAPSVVENLVPPERRTLRPREGAQRPYSSTGERCNRGFISIWGCDKVAQA
ncbi:hypothetical protein KSP39_PZI009604 [Platanthera zijinensis]|uniref:Uncharacterized protein n=1 Tax=Platanthera zijinensis TaxID=2320716 RepID=A0AAP0BKR9_9ASPA